MIESPLSNNYGAKIRQLEIEKKYWEGYLNGDDADAFILPTEYINLQEFRYGMTSDKGFARQLESVGGTLLIPSPTPVPPLSQNICIGIAYDNAHRRVVFFMYNTQGEHEIFCFDYMANAIYEVLQSSQVTGGLNFDKNHLIHSARVENGSVYWTDNLNEPRRVNIDAGIKMNQPSYVTPIVAYVTPVSQSVIAWIRRQPGLPPLQTKIMPAVVTAAPNFIAKEAFQFAYRYQYRTYEYSTLSALSTLADFNEEDSPPSITNLNIPNTSLFSGAYLATNFLLPTSTTPAYGPNIQAKITRVGTAGPNAGAADISIPLNWVGYPATRTVTRVIVEGVNAYFHQLPGNGSTGVLSAGPRPASIPQSGKWYISYRDGVHPTLNILQTWDWGLADAAFPPTTEANLTLYTSTPTPSKQFNEIDISIPLAEKIDQDVLQVDLIANYLLSGVFFIIKSWNKLKAAEAAQIAAHNAGTSALAYHFLNNQVGIAIDSAYAVKPFDSVPLLAATIEMAKNRGFMGNYLIGYNSSALITSLATSFTITVVGAAVGSFITGTWYLINFFNAARTQVYHEYVIKTATSVTFQPFSPQYYYTVAGAAPPFPITITTGLIPLGTSYTDIMAYYLTQTGDSQPGNLGSVVNQNITVALLSQNQAVNYGVLAKAFKANSFYQAAITFYDFAGRKCGVITNDTLKLTIPNTGFSANQYVTAINWTLSNTNALAEIPPWAYYYSIDLTKNLRTRFFVEAVGFGAYATKDVSGNYTFTNLVYSSDLAGVAIDISFLASNGMGYIFTQGDAVNIYVNGANYNLAVIGQSGKYIICDLYNIGALGGSALMQYEIYTPYQQSTVEPYFEMSQLFAVFNPATAGRQYSVTQGQIAGDVFLFQRQNFSITYIAEAMSPNNKLYTRWFTDAGRPNFTDTIGQVSKVTSVAYSNTFIAGSQNNGLSTFDALDAEDLSPDFGPIQKLQLASKVQQIGTVMLAICSGPATASIYLSENTLISQTGDSVIAQANTVIGSVHELRGAFGTLHPESVIEFRGAIYWYDLQNSKVVQYADNGLFPISNYKLSRYWNLFSQAYKALTADQIEALGSRPFVFGTADPQHGELLFTVPRTLSAPPLGYLPDYPSEPYPFDIWDGQGKTIVYKLYTDPNRWQGSYAFTPEYSFYMENNLYLFKHGDLYVGNQSANYCNYFGVQYQPKVMCLSNQQLNKPKSYNNASVEGNQAPQQLYMMARYPNLQSSDLVVDDFKNLEGIFYAPILRNRLDPAFDNNFSAALIAGEKMRTTALYIMGKWDATAGIVQVKFLNVGYTLSLGQKA